MDDFILIVFVVNIIFLFFAIWLITTIDAGYAVKQQRLKTREEALNKYFKYSIKSLRELHKAVRRRNKHIRSLRKRLTQKE